MRRLITKCWSIWQSFFCEDADSETIEVVQAACLVRTATAPLLGAMLPQISADDALARLRGLPFVSAGPHGLLVHDAVRGAVTAALKSRDPVRYQAYRRAASQVLRDQYRQAPRSDHWRCTADVLYLLANQNLREGFFPQRRRVRFPSSRHARTIGRRILAIVRKFNGAQSCEVLEQWWQLSSGVIFCGAR